MIRHRGFASDCSNSVITSACSISPALKPNGPRPPLYTTRPLRSITYNRAGMPLYALPVLSSMSSINSGIDGFSRLWHCCATAVRSANDFGCATCTPTLSFDCIAQPSVGCASRT